MVGERLTGRWIERNGLIVADETCRRIELLLASHLKELCHDSTGWYTLLRDSRDGQLWELSYPESQMHGGGPPQLAIVSIEEARRRYGEVPN